MSLAERLQPLIILGAACFGLVIGQAAEIAAPAKALILPLLIAMLTGAFLHAPLRWLGDVRQHGGVAALSLALLPANLALQLLLLPVYLLLLAGAVVPLAWESIALSAGQVLLLPLGVATVLRGAIRRWRGRGMAGAARAAGDPANPNNVPGAGHRCDVRRAGVTAYPESNCLPVAAGATAGVLRDQFWARAGALLGHGLSKCGIAMLHNHGAQLAAGAGDCTSCLP